MLLAFAMKVPVAPNADPVTWPMCTVESWIDADSSGHVSNADEMRITVGPAITLIAGQLFVLERLRCWRIEEATERRPPSFPGSEIAPEPSGRPCSAYRTRIIEFDSRTIPVLSS